MSVNKVAFLTTTSSAAATITTALAAAQATATAATVAYTVMSLGLGAAGIASITAWVDKTSVDVGSYFANMQKHVGYTAAGTFQFASQTIIAALVQGIADGVSKAISRKIAGPDVTVKHS